MNHVSAVDDPLYFKAFEARTPPAPLSHSWCVEMLWQIMATITLIVGAWYLHWRWFDSLNMEALWFAVPLVAAETLAYFGLVLYVINLWNTRDTKPQEAPHYYSQCVAESHPLHGQVVPITVDVMITTYNEDVRLVEQSVIDAQKLRYDHPIDVRVHVLDDGDRIAMKQMAKKQGVAYITRQSREGYKAGNLSNGIRQTHGQFIVICDADTRLYPDILYNTLGYFRDAAVSWVQTPQWFYDVPEGKNLPESWRKKAGWLGWLIGKGIERSIGKVTVGADPFCNDSAVFYDIIQRRRNGANASFCCGASSIHRRETVVENALHVFAEKVTHAQKQQKSSWKEAMQSQRITPYEYHVSEDIYTSIQQHRNRARQWKSVYHPHVESRMLSPQDIKSWMTQRFKYAGGSLDILMHDNPLIKRGFTLKQRIMYLATFWSYLGCFWSVVFLIGPLVYLYTGISPVMSETVEFFKHLIPFLLLTEASFMVGTWGRSTFKNKAHYLCFFSLYLKAFFTVLRRKEIKFHVTPKQRAHVSNALRYVWPHISIQLLTLLGISWMFFNYFALDNLRYGPNGLVINSFWGLYNVYVLSYMVRAAFWKPQEVYT